MTIPNFSRRNVLLGGLAASVIPSPLWPQDRQVEGGIGGTGIVGIITDLDPLIVAGQVLSLTSRTDVSDAFGDVAANTLAIGDSVTIEAAGGARGLVARRISVSHPLVGQVTERQGNTAIVNGVVVDLRAIAAKPRVGQRIAVSGLWQGQRVVASRVGPARSSRDVIAGDIARNGVRFAMGGVRLAAIPIGPADGRFVTVQGTYATETARFDVQRATRERFVGAAGPLQRLAVEGFLETTERAPGFRISGLGHSFAPNLRLDAFADNRVLFTGGYTGDFAATDAVVLPEDVARRRRVLRSLALRT